MTTTPRLIGQQSVFTITFRDDDGALVDPATVTCIWKPGPSAAETTYTFGTDSEISKNSTGVYEFVAPPFTSAVSHFLRSKSTAPITATETRVAVQNSSFTAP